jgi:phosphatidylserine/phosphatidylglycerophosphate/cardiolipin synthase-like enzyme
VHAKIGSRDDAWLAIGSANLNEHSPFNDTEVDVVTACDEARPRHGGYRRCGPVGRHPLLRLARGSRRAAVAERSRGAR